MPQAGWKVTRGLLALPLAAFACGVLAQAYPAKPVRLIVTYVVKGKFADLGVEALSSTPQQFASFIKAEMEKYAKLIKEAGIKGQ